MVAACGMNYDCLAGAAPLQRMGVQAGLIEAVAVLFHSCSGRLSCSAYAIHNNVWIGPAFFQTYASWMPVAVITAPLILWQLWTCGDVR